MRERHVEGAVGRTLTKEMLQLLKQSHVDPISYVGLAYCGINAGGSAVLKYAGSDIFDVR
jgi:hypothetical protein